MNEELTLAAMNLFDSADKWTSFCELMNKSDDIQNKWWKKLQTEVYQRELKNPTHDWEVYIWNEWDIMWYIQGESNKSLAVHFWGDAFRLVSGFGDLDIFKVNDLIKDPKFDILRNAFDRIDEIDLATIGLERRNFHFQTIYDGMFPDYRTLSWYAGNRTDEFADQLIAKVRKFQTPEITELFKEINMLCKKV